MYGYLQQTVYRGIKLVVEWSGCSCQWM